MTKRLLIVDDEQIYLDLIEECLEDSFEYIDKSNSLEDAYEKLGQNEYSCLIVDINLGTNNGAQIVKYCQDNNPGNNANTPTIIMSGLVNDEFIEKFKDKFAGILSKPFKNTDLNSKVAVVTSSPTGLKSRLEGTGFGTDKIETKMVAKLDKKVGIELEDGTKFDVLAYDPDVSAPFKVHDIEKKVSKHLETIRKNKKLKDIFSKIKYNPKDPYCVKQIGLIINISSGIAKEMDWGSEQTLEKFVFASYLHDISLGSNAKLAKVTSFDINEAQNLSSDEAKLLKFHPQVSARMIEEKKDIPQDVLTIVEQHHELPKGKGFPNGSDHKRIIPLASIFIVAHWMSDFILQDKSWTMEKFINEFKPHSKGPHFTKIFRILERL